MSQHDFVLDNATAAALRADLNLALLALASLSAGTSAPSSPTTYQLWLDTTTATAMVLAMYDGTDWITLFTIDTSANSAAAAGALANIVEDTSPQLGALLDSNSFQIRWSKGADVASGSALPVISDGNYFDVTGTTGITSIDDLGGDGTVIKLHFDAAATLTHHTTNLILPGAANYTTAAGDELEFVNYATGDWRMTGYALASGLPIVAGNIGKHALFIPAAAMRATVSNGAAAINDVETTAGRPDISAFDFDASADEAVQFGFYMPPSYNAGTVTYKVLWESTAGDTDGVAWALQGIAVADNASIDQAYGTAVVVTDDNQGAAEEQLVTAESGAVTIANAAASLMTYFRAFRDVSDVNDDMTEDARMIGVVLFITTNAGTDA